MCIDNYVCYSRSNTNRHSHSKLTQGETMSCTIVAKEGKTVYMISDMRVLGDTLVSTEKYSKIFEISKDVTISFAGDARAMQDIAYGMSIHDDEIEDGEELRYTVDTLAYLAMELKKDEDDIEAIIRVKNRLFRMGGDGFVFEVEMDTIGAGAEFALGSLHTTGLLYSEMSLVSRLYTAMEAASEHEVSVGNIYELREYNL